MSQCSLRRRGCHGGRDIMRASQDWPLPEDDASVFLPKSPQMLAFQGRLSVLAPPPGRAPRGADPGR